MQNYRKNNTKIAVALIIILLCVTSLAGVTLALFTNGEDGIIGINVTSGDIDIDIVDRTGATLIGDTLDFIGWNGDPNDIIWEPGAVFCTQPFAINNDGAIPISYRMYVECKDEDAKLLEALEFYIISETVMNSIDTRDKLSVLDASQKMTSFDGKLEAETMSDYYHLVVRMKSEADNDYQGLELNGVGITVYAVQGNVDVPPVIPNVTDSESENVNESTEENVSESTDEQETEAQTDELTD